MSIYNEIPGFLARNKFAALCVVTDTEGSTPRKIGSKMLVAPDGTTLGTVGGGAIEQQVIAEALEVIRSGKPQKKYYHLDADLNMQCGGNVEVYTEPLASRPKLYIFGAGHVGKALAAFAHNLDFDITLLDFRPIAFTDHENQHYQFVEGDYFQNLEELEYDENTFTVIMTPSHDDDFKLLEQLGKKPMAYLGMIGSKRKVARVRDLFLSENKLTREQLDQVDMPMGLAMLAETPQEIAISILGKIIDVRNKRLKA